MGECVMSMEAMSARLFSCYRYVISGVGILHSCRWCRNEWECDHGYGVWLFQWIGIQWFSYFVIVLDKNMGQLQALQPRTPNCTQVMVISMCTKKHSARNSPLHCELCTKVLGWWSKLLIPSKECFALGCHIFHTNAPRFCVCENLLYDVINVCENGHSSLKKHTVLYYP